MMVTSSGDISALERVIAGWSALPGLDSIPDLLASCWTTRSWPLQLGSAATLIVIPADGVSMAAAQQAWAPDELRELRSTFPSTSVAAWLTATTGLSPSLHGVPGPMFRLGENLLFSCLADAAAAHSTSWGPTDCAPELSPSPRLTIFERLVLQDAEPTVLLGDLVNFGGRWADALLSGARRVVPVDDWAVLRQQPEAAVQSVVRDVDRALAVARPNASRLIWAFAHLDPYVHRHGYDQQMLAALASLERACRRWAETGYLVVCHADHGLVRTVAREQLPPEWDSAAGPNLCRLPPGGAGRVRWWYPHPGREAEVGALARAALGTDAAVLAATDLVDLGLIDPDSVLLQRVGEVVAIAVGERFPLVDPTDRYEHGSLTAEEMRTPLAIWGARR